MHPGKNGLPRCKLVGAGSWDSLWSTRRATLREGWREHWMVFGPSSDGLSKLQISLSLTTLVPQVTLQSLSPPHCRRPKDRIYGAPFLPSNIAISPHSTIQSFRVVPALCGHQSGMQVDARNSSPWLLDTSVPSLFVEIFGILFPQSSYILPFHNSWLNDLNNVKWNLANCLRQDCRFWFLAKAK